MFTVSSVKVSELAHILGCPNSDVVERLKSTQISSLELRSGRIAGVPPEAVEAFLRKKGRLSLFDNFITLVGANVGGVGKTSATVNLAAASRRITARSRAVVIIDTDCQGSATTQVLGEVIPDHRPVLDDYLSGKAKLEDILTPVGDEKENVWIIGSNLNNIYLDRRFSNANHIRGIMKGLLTELFDHFDGGAKIFIDTPPQLSAVTQSATCALAQMDVRSVFLIPLRADLFSIKGAKICLSSLEDLVSAYKDVDKINVKCVLSSYDARLKVSSDTMRVLLEDEQLSKYICNVVVRQNSEVTKAAMKRENIFTSNSTSNVASDYLDLAFHIFEDETKAGRE